MRFPGRGLWDKVEGAVTRLFWSMTDLASVVLLRMPALGEESRAPSFQAVRQNSVLTESSYHVSGL